MPLQIYDKEANDDMKIEKVNEQQIRCTLTREDLANRQLKISELAYGTEKAKTLFRDLIQQASFECGFEAEDIPLMIEAVPLSAECIVLIVTKVEDPEEIDTRFAKFAPSVHDEDFELDDDDNEALMEAFADSADEVLNLLRRMNSEENAEDAQTASANGGSSQTGERMASRLYSFRSLREVTRLAHLTGGSFEGGNTLYKDSGTGAYLLHLHPGNASAADYSRLCHLISEYATPEKTTGATGAYLEEHCEPIIKDSALMTLSQL
ncbi:MAG: adaptor protein MecA [Bacteroidales bacterium]|nr:adaptor protein MecA [Bacteroidales bacterium]MCM1416189.1 adaptor protein MecA [bacterium]MCM1424214.1 adaptor protein MecA [bacterium]